MIKKLLVAIALAIPMVCGAQTLKIGLVNTNEVIAALPETTTAQNTLAEAQKKYEAEYNKLGEELNRQYEEIKNMKADELPAIKERKAREVADQQQKLQLFEQQIMQDLEKKQQELMQPIITKVRTAIEAVGREGSYSLIQDSNPQLTLYYGAPVEDITAKVKAKLNLK